MTLEQEFDAAVKQMMELAHRIEGCEGSENIEYAERHNGHGQVVDHDAKRYSLAVTFPLPLKLKEPTA